MSGIAVLAEKPSVARDVARVLGANSQGQGYLHGNGYVVTWAIGHLVALPQPHEINPEWRQWRASSLPMLPQRWPLTVYDKTKDQFEVVRKILTSPRIENVVCATDAGREGELIFRYIYEAAQCNKPFRRLWISSLTPDAIRKGFESLRPGSDYDALADAASGRSRADWLVGMNLSRAYSIAHSEELSVGRVQTPTLAMVVDRELAIRNFDAKDYLEVIATFQPEGKSPQTAYQGTWFRSRENLQESMRLPADGEEARRIVARARTGAAYIESIGNELQRHPPLQFYDLTELQRHANRLFGFSAQKTLELAQALYERHKLISYPRTDSRHLSQDVAATLPRVVGAVVAPYRANLAPGTGERPLGKRFVDDAKVTDHHAIIPTAASSARASLSEEERKIYDLICRRLLTAWHDDHIVSVTTVITAISNPDILDRYYTSGSTVQQVGWKVLDLGGERKGRKIEEPKVPLSPELEKGQPQSVTKVEAVKKKTSPPKRYTEATLLTAMETAGKTLDEKELSDAMKESGLGTPATRASIIEVLLKRSYIEREGKNLLATEKGIRLIEIVHPDVKSPAMTGTWEAYLKRIQKGVAPLPPFLSQIEEYVRRVINEVQRADSPKPASPAPIAPPGAVAITAKPSEPLSALLNRAFGFSSFRANQEAVCQAAVEGKDVLLVMPTGAGKSLCYQLPAIARGGTALVISPLIALMEDQAAKLRKQGFAVEQIHSGRDRVASRHACNEYLHGNLQFLFIAPERLRVPGFPEMLAKRKPSLIAIDEAHCISQWGHDFRPDYRMLGQHLPNLRPAPLIALTATATTLVQDDIAAQLGVRQCARFIHGFRRKNLAIEVVEVPVDDRDQLALRLLLSRDRRPAIVYAPTRRHTAALAAELAVHFPAAAYHAGLDSDHRQRVQSQFLAGKIEVMVATIAFGMGIDKPDVRTVIHMALPASVEAYYQEIGRAGRDGEPSRAILMHSYADRRTHDFFFERDYPPPSELARIGAALSSKPQPKEVLQHQVQMGSDLFDKALEKLWIHGGAVLDFAENVTRGHDHWLKPYEFQGEQKRAQIEQVIRYSEGDHCRMSSLVRHFGDFSDGQASCGICDFCAPDRCAAQRFRPPMEWERAAASQVILKLRSQDSKSTGKLHAELFPGGGMDRGEFEDLLGALSRAGILRLTDAVFEKDGKTIPYRKAALSRSGRAEGGSIEFLMKDSSSPAPVKAKSKKKKKGAPKPKRKLDLTINPRIEGALREWRLAQAKRLGVPAFRIFSDQAMRAIAMMRPANAGELLAISGISAGAVEKYGKDLYRILRQTNSAL